ncbi:MAG: hypothetical protein JWN69_168, partial [Alphaproteobacteria bacterium]|nr:hypothetical protein [Alphaproteobacteria bacterium]
MLLVEIGTEPAELLDVAEFGRRDDLVLAGGEDAIVEVR